MATVTKTTTTIKLPPSLFGLEVKNHQLLHTAVRSYLAAQRQVSAQSLTRGQVRGGGRKPHAQKGTGRARAGSIRSPLWRGGGITFGPTGKENYQINLPQKARQLALKQALSLKREQTEVIANLKLNNPKTKALVTVLGKERIAKATLLVIAAADLAIERAASNLPDLTVITVGQLNVYQILKADKLLLTNSALQTLEQRLIPETKVISDSNAKVVNNG